MQWKDAETTVSANGTFMSDFTGGRYIGLERHLAAIAYRVHNAHVPCDGEADACPCLRCRSEPWRGVQNNPDPIFGVCGSAPEAGPAAAFSPLLPAGPVALAAHVERDMQDRLREHDAAERSNPDQGPPPWARGPAQDESSRLDPLDALAMRVVEGRDDERGCEAEGDAP